MKQWIKFLLLLASLFLFLSACGGGGGGTTTGGEGGEGGKTQESYIEGYVELQGQTNHSGATVYLEEGSAYRATSRSDGYYRISNPPAGTYKPVAKKAGYYDKVWDGVPLNIPGRHSNVNFSLRPL